MKTFTLMTFKQSGKWYADGEFTAPEGMNMYEITRAWILNENSGKCPGLISNGAEFDWLILPKGDHDFPKIMKAGA